MSLWAWLEAAVKLGAVLVTAWTARPPYEMAERPWAERIVDAAVRSGTALDVVQAGERRAVIQHRRGQP